MADKKKVDAGKTFAQQVFAKIPEGKRAAVVALLEDPEAADALEALGAGTLLQSDYSRAMNEVKAGEDKNVAYKGSLDSWWNSNAKELNDLRVKVALLEEGGKKPAGGDDPDNKPPIRTEMPDLTGFVKKEDVEKQINDRVAAASNQVVPLVSVLTKLSMQHYKNFGEILDTDALIEFSRKNTISIDRGGYEAFAKDLIDAKAKKSHDDEIAAAEKRGAEAARAAIQTTPYPTGPSQEPLTLSGITRKDKQPTPGEFGVAAAVADFNKAVAARG